MEETPAGAPSGSRVRAGLLLIGVLIIAAGIALFRRFDALSERIGVIVDAGAGSIRIAGDAGVPARVQWLADPSDPRLAAVPADSGEGERWDEVVARVLPGSSLVSIERPIVSRQSVGTGSEKREVIAERAILVVAPPGGGSEPALGIGVGVARPGDPEATIARTIVRLVGPTGASERIDAAPLFHDPPMTLLDRLKGGPAHVVRFEIELVDEGGTRAPPSGAPAAGGENATEGRALDEEEARQAIEKLRRERPERGVIPKPPAGVAPPSEPQTPPDPGRASA